MSGFRAKPGVVYFHSFLDQVQVFVLILVDAVLIVQLTVYWFGLDVGRKNFRGQIVTVFEFGLRLILEP